MTESASVIHLSNHLIGIGPIQEAWCKSDLTAAPTIRYLGHAGFQLQKGSYSLVIDPRSKDAANTPCDMVYCTHRHIDHVGGVNAILEHNPDAILIGNRQVTAKFSKWGERVVTVSAGEVFNRGPWKFEFINCQHGLFKGVIDLGLLARTSGLTFGHCGDTVTFDGFVGAQMDVFAIPICGVLAASPKRAIAELEKFSEQMPYVVVMHWLWRSPNRFARRFASQFPDSRCTVPSDGEIISF